MKEIGWMMLHVVKEYTFTLMEQDMKVSGQMTINMVKGLRLGLMDLFIKEITEWEKRMELAS